MAAPSSWRRRIPAGLLALAVAALAVALARPERTVQVAVEQASVVLVTDASGSMEATDVQPSRLVGRRQLGGVVPGEGPGRHEGRARRLLDRALRRAGADHQPRHRPRHARQPVRRRRHRHGRRARRRAVDPRPQPGRARRRLDARASRRPRSSCCRTASRRAGATRTTSRASPAGCDVPIYTVALGTPDGTVPGPFGDPIAVPPDPEQLRRVARFSGGRFFAVEDADRLDAVYKTPRQPAGHQAAPARDHLGLRGARPAAARRSPPGCPFAGGASSPRPGGQGVRSAGAAPPARRARRARPRSRSRPAR